MKFVAPRNYLMKFTNKARDEVTLGTSDGEKLGKERGSDSTVLVKGEHFVVFVSATTQYNTKDRNQWTQMPLSESGGSQTVVMAHQSLSVLTNEARALVKDLTFKFRMVPAASTPNLYLVEEVFISPGQASSVNSSHQVKCFQCKQPATFECECTTVSFCTDACRYDAHNSRAHDMTTCSGKLAVILAGNLPQVRAYINHMVGLRDDETKRAVEMHANGKSQSAVGDAGPPALVSRDLTAQSSVSIEARAEVETRQRTQWQDAVTAFAVMEKRRLRAARRNMRKELSLDPLPEFAEELDPPVPAGFMETNHEDAPKIMPDTPVLQLTANGEVMSTTAAASYAEEARLIADRGPVDNPAIEAAPIGALSADQIEIVGANGLRTTLAQTFSQITDRTPEITETSAYPEETSSP